MAPNIGHQWERALEAQHRLYRRDRRGVFFKTEPKRNKAGLFIGKGGPDYLGFLPGPVAVAFEAKATRARRFNLSMLKPHQARDLEAVHLTGAIAFVALNFHGVGYLLDWHSLRERHQAYRTKTGPSSLTAEQVKSYPVMGGKYGADWLGVL